jgi:uncharacterized protein YegL
MAGDKIQSLNYAIRSTIPVMRDAARGNPNVEVLVRAIRFSNGAAWHVDQPTPIDQFQWTDLSVSGLTDFGAALRLLAGALSIPPMSGRAVPPVIVLVSDGQPTDEWKQALEQLKRMPWGAKALRVAIGIGQDVDLDMLRQFATPEIEPLQANNPDALTHYIRWTSTAVLQAASQPASRQTPTAAIAAVPVPAPPAPSTVDPSDVF